MQLSSQDLLIIGLGMWILFSSVILYVIAIYLMNRRTVLEIIMYSKNHQVIQKDEDIGHYAERMYKKTKYGLIYFVVLIVALGIPLLIKSIYSAVQVVADNIEMSGSLFSLLVLSWSCLVVGFLCVLLLLKLKRVYEAFLSEPGRFVEVTNIPDL